MTSKQHPDMKHEQERLEFTKRYIEVVVKTAATSKDQFKKIMQETFGDEDWQESGRYSELLTTANFFDMSKAELENLRKAKSKPYFARVDFKRDENALRKFLFWKGIPYINGKIRSKLSWIGVRRLRTFIMREELDR